MKILVLENELPNATMERFQEYAVVEARKVWALVQAGVIREIILPRGSKRGCFGAGMSKCG